MTTHNQPAAATEPTNEPAPPATEPAKIISHAEMNTHIDNGLVRPLGDTIAFAVHYDTNWWILYEGGWIRADQNLNALLDGEAKRITRQDAIIARNATIRATAARDEGADRSRGTGDR